MIAPLPPFLKNHHHSKKPLLLALSGGPDSLALLHMLLELRTYQPLDFAIAHVDHDWRPESGTEAETLKALAKTHELTFHLKKLDPKTLEGNLEAACRLERLQFFQELCQKYDYEAVLMAHHADDAAETVLKRIFEGSSLKAISGLQEVSIYEGLQIWRPLLTTTKAEILEWLSSRSLTAFNDSTNDDTRFLRARMRHEILPYLNSHFGKSITPSLLRLSDEASALDHYLQERIKPYTDSIIEGKWGLLLDLSQNLPPHPYELKEVVRHFALKHKISLSRESLDNCVDLLWTNSANKRIVSGEKTIYIDRKRLFLPFDLPAPLESLPLNEGENWLGPWKITVQPLADNKIQISQGWSSVWKGECSVNLPRANYSIASIAPGTSYRNKSRIDDFWNDDKVPAFLRPHVPGIWMDSTLIHEFLSDRKHVHSASEALHIKLEFTGLSV